MAAFTNSFDITNGLSSSTNEEVDATEGLAGMTSTFNDSNAEAVAQAARDARLPVLNARGISIVMACSRLLMLAQYGLGSQSPSQHV